MNSKIDLLGNNGAHFSKHSPIKSNASILNLQGF